MRLLLLVLVLLAGCGRPPSQGVDWFQFAQQELAVGRLRIERSPEDVVVTPAILTQNFRKIAFNPEADPLRSGRLQPGLDEPIIRKWLKPMVYSLVASPPNEARIAPMLTGIARRLSSVTGHEVRPVAPDGDDTRLLVIFAPDAALEGLSDPETLARAGWQTGRQGMEWIAGSIATWRFAPSPCGAFVLIRDDEEVGKNGEIVFGLVLVRTEMPDLLLQACVEEEMSQAMGTLNDDELVRPSVFNDDQEFALLTQHDMDLLRLLYDPEIVPGMGPEVAMPIVRRRLKSE